MIHLAALLLCAAAQDPFEYEDADVPFYAGSHKLGESWKRMQRPVEAKLSAKRLRVPDGFEARLFASDPDIVKPVALAWDARGRLWISETIDYPNEMQPEGLGRDRLKICEDTDGDGRADRFTIFADKLSIPTSLVFANGGVIVAQAPHMLFLRDSDGDDRADERRVLFSGWGTGDTHAGPSNLRWGFDNRIWGIVGYSGFNGTVGGKKHQFAMGFYRFKPDGSELEFIRSTNNNSWGTGFSEDGQLFGSTANGNPSEYMPIANRYYEGVRGWSASRLNGISDNPEFHPVTDKVRQVDAHGRFTAAAGHALYTARLFPKEYWNRTAFVCEPTGHLVATFEITADGAAFRSKPVWNLAASDDEWTAPIAAEVGPDGAVWMLDWYNYIVQHNPTPAGFKNGRGNAYEIGLRDKRHGRIYRILPKGAATPAPLRLDRASDADLVAALGNDNLFWRLHAQRLLVERGAKAAVPALEARVRDRSVDALGLAPGALHALWTLHGLGALDPALGTGALGHPSAAVRRAAAMTLPQGEALLPMLTDPDAQVRLAALLALSESSASPEAGAAVFAALRKPENAGDKWIPDAITAAGARHDAGFLRAALAGFKAEGPAAAAPSSANKIRNASFEDPPGPWRKAVYAGKAELDIAPEGRHGTKSARIRSESGADASWSFNAEVRPGVRYRLSAWIRTKDLAAGSGRGALLNIHELQNPPVATAAVSGTSDWRRVETTFSAEGVEKITVNCLFGGWGQSRGEACFDEVSLVELSGAGLAGRAGAVVSTVTRHYARRGPADSVADVLVSLRAADPALAAFVLDGLAEGWPDGVRAEISADRVPELAALMESLPVERRERLLTLANRWGRRDLFAGALKSTADALTARLADAKATAEERVAAARSLIRLDDTEETLGRVLSPAAPPAPPALVLGLIDAAVESRCPSAGAAFLSRWEQFTPAAKGRTLAALLRQPAWTASLLEALEMATLPKSELGAAQWQQLKVHPDAAVAARAAKLAASGAGAVSADREALYQKLLPLTERQGDVARGRELFTTLCAKCHRLGDAVGRVGPELNGIGARARKDILLEIVDPNRSVEMNFRMWQVKTLDGQVLAGRLDTETQTTVELLDVEGKAHVVPRASIELMKASALSIMPVGLVDQLPEADLAALLEYLASSREGPAKKK